MISRVMESCVLIGTLRHSTAELQMNMQIAVVVHPHAVVGMHEHRRYPHLDTAGLRAPYRLEEVAIVDSRAGVPSSA